MGEKSESNSENELRAFRMAVLDELEDMKTWIKDLENQVIRMQRSFDALGRRLEGSERHVEDEGWFD
tara:strand:- start:134 stop:334 length:201 start_codon:yes stop_codon:yes gene_type:complete